MNRHVFWLVVVCSVAWATTGCGRKGPYTPLHSAIQQGQVQIIQQHIAAGTDLNAKDSSGWTPLHHAVLKGDLAIVQLLAEAGADATRKGNQGKTVLDLAREKKHAAIVQYLEARNQKGGRRLIDGGVGVSEVLDAF
ncbi:MAG: ankyrin repeat domain-containing protein [Verrucomicrobia bacterium]|nr:ankyrin repeat domain-containing protein [Verrucomicrobiota bacterium]